MPTYKISYVVPDKKHPGGIINLDYCPVRGETLVIGDVTYTVREVIELMPPQGLFHYLHVTCETLEE
ncbi:MAG: hypothetical protein U9O54_03790 [Chloroflexota bacterium]|nr:hypothetical protein [Chloroflexota bacterium]